MAISPSTLSDGTVGIPYSDTILTTLSGGILWSTSGSLPLDLTLKPSGNPTTLSGTPITAGSYTFTIQAKKTTSPGIGTSDSRSYTLKINPAPSSTYYPPTSDSYTLTLCSCSGEMAMILYSDVSGLIVASDFKITDPTGTLSPYSTIFGTLIPVIEKTAGLQCFTTITLKKSDNTTTTYTALNCDEEKALITSDYQLVCCANKLFLGISGDMSDHITYIPGSSDALICFVLNDLTCSDSCSDVSFIVCGSDAANYQHLKKIIILSTP